MLDISNIKSKLIGISFLSGEEAQIVNKLWRDSFPRTDAFWVEASASETGGEIAKKVFKEIGDAGLPGLSGLSCAVVLFLDFSGEDPGACIPTIKDLSFNLQKALFCTIELELQYVYIGSNPTFRSGADRLKEAIVTLTRSSADAPEISKRACLIARSLVDQSGSADHWSAAVFYLDLLRRCSVNDALPTFGPNGNDDVCFIRYGEYDGPRYEALQSKLRELDRLRGTAGFAELRNELDKRLGELRRQVEERFQISPKDQPIHPDMKVEGFFAVKKAKHGTNAQFAAAQKFTRNALLKTGDAMAEDIKALYAAALGPDPKQYLDALLDSVGIGVELLTNRLKLGELFDTGGISIVHAQLPGFAYNENGYDQEIQSYLTQVRDCAAAEGRKAFLEKLREAYASVTEDEITQKKIRINQLLTETNAELALVPSEETFIKELRDSGAALSAYFKPTKPGGMTKRLLIDSDVNAAQRHDAMVNKDVTVMLLPGFQTSTVSAVKPKAFQLLSFDCDMDRIEDLIKEVDM